MQISHAGTGMPECGLALDGKMQAQRGRTMAPTLQKNQASKEDFESASIS
jgi:hypothetical protein